MYTNTPSEVVKNCDLLVLHRGRLQKGKTCIFLQQQRLTDLQETEKIFDVKWEGRSETNTN